MCRALAYIGEPIKLDDLLFNPDNSLIKQSYEPLQMVNMLNLVGFGMAAWQPNSNDPDKPLLYRSEKIPVHNKNLKQLSKQMQANCLLAHVRGVTFTPESVVNSQCLHPFKFQGCPLAMAHNATLHGYPELKQELYNYMNPELIGQIRGSTDSEMMYTLMLSQLKNPYEDNDIQTVSEAVLKTLDIIKKVRAEHHHTHFAPANFFISNGKYLLITRYAFNAENKANEPYSYLTLWYTQGDHYGLINNEYQMHPGKKSILFASEPLTQNTNTWQEIPEHSLITATPTNNEYQINITPVQ